MALGGSDNGTDIGLDLETVRETLALIHEDLRQRPELVGVRKALVAAIEEIALAEAQAGSAGWGLKAPQHTPVSNVVTFPGQRPQFVRWTPAAG